MPGMWNDPGFKELHRLSNRQLRDFGFSLDGYVDDACAPYNEEEDEEEDEEDDEEYEPAQSAFNEFPEEFEQVFADDDEENEDEDANPVDDDEDNKEYDSGGESSENDDEEEESSEDDDSDSDRSDDDDDDDSDSSDDDESTKENDEREGSIECVEPSLRVVSQAITNKRSFGQLVDNDDQHDQAGQSSGERPSIALRTKRARYTNTALNPDRGRIVLDDLHHAKSASLVDTATLIAQDDINDSHDTPASSEGIPPAGTEEGASQLRCPDCQFSFDGIKSPDIHLHFVKQHGHVERYKIAPKEYQVVCELTRPDGTKCNQIYTGTNPRKSHGEHIVTEHIPGGKKIYPCGNRGNGCMQRFKRTYERDRHMRTICKFKTPSTA